MNKAVGIEPDGVLGLGGWQWVFILEALPAILLGLFSLVWRTDRPEQAAWLTAEQRAWLANKLLAERGRATATVAGATGRSLTVGMRTFSPRLAIG